ncbi:hypothetical protein ACHAXA_011765 [Cyclostephanos tholiformis]|uniref:Nitroreductase domain-containing protein n=1 Tax=Cyclostephanos tholiformis TaxID=382380 RepID=A0ABD3RXN1_9STRA
MMCACIWCNVDDLVSSPLAMTKIATLARTAVTATIAKRTVGRVSLAPVSSYTASSSPPSDAEAAATIAREDRHAVAKSKLKAFRRIVNDRVSARRFLPDTPVPDAVWNDILRMTRTAPSGFNLQPTSVILLRSPAIKRTLAEHAMLGVGNKYRTIDSSGIAIFCADLRPGMRVHRIHELEREAGTREDGYMSVMRVASTFLTGEGGFGGGGGGGRLSAFAKRMFTDALSPVRPMPTMEDVGMWSYKNAGIISQLYTMAASAHGLSTCMMEGYDARRAMEILRVPHERYGLPIMVATGYEYGALPAVHADTLGGKDDEEEEEYDHERCGRTPRLGMNETFFGDTFGEPLDFLLNGITPLESETAT